MCFSLGSRNAGAASARFNASYTATAMREIRSEEHTSELQSQSNLVCRLLLEKKKQSVYAALGGGSVAGALAGAGPDTGGPRAAVRGDLPAFGGALLARQGRGCLRLVAVHVGL